MKKWDEALAASDLAMKMGYGPRKIGFYQTRADIYLGRGDRATARKTLEDAVLYAQALPQGQRNDKTIASLKKRIDGLEQSAKKEQAAKK